MYADLEGKAVLDRRLDRHRRRDGNLLIGSASSLDHAARAVTAGLALRQVWSAFQNNVEDDRSGVSLNPRIGARRFGVNATFHC